MPVDVTDDTMFWCECFGETCRNKYKPLLVTYETGILRMNSTLTDVWLLVLGIVYK